MVEIIKKGTVWRKRDLYFVKGSPLFGYIAFGVIDRGTNVLQVRPTTLCPLNCIFCSVDAGPHSRIRWAEFIVDKDSIVEAIAEIASYKGGGVEALIDTIGDAFTYPWLIELVRELKSMPCIRSVAIETHGELLSRKIIVELDKAGLDRINLSLDTLDPEKAVFLQGVKWYNVRKVIELAEFIVNNTNIDLHVTPVWIPGVNDEDVKEVVKWAYRIGAGKKWPPATIQKYNVHKYGRKVPGAKVLSWRDFWRKLKDLERELGLRLTWSMEEWGMYRAPRYPCPYRRGDRLCARVLSKGIFKGEYVAEALNRPWLIALRGRRVRISDIVAVEIIEDQDSLLIGRMIGYC